MSNAVGSYPQAVWNAFNQLASRVGPYVAPAAQWGLEKTAPARARCCELFHTYAPIVRDNVCSLALRVRTTLEENREVRLASVFGVGILSGNCAVSAASQNSGVGTLFPVYFATALGAATYVYSEMKSIQAEHAQQLKAAEAKQQEGAARIYDLLGITRPSVLPKTNEELIEVVATALKGLSDASTSTKINGIKDQIAGLERTVAEFTTKVNELHAAQQVQQVRRAST